MKIALLGHGNLGKEIERVVEESGTHEIVSISFEHTEDPLDIEGVKSADVVIDATSPEIVLENIREVSKLGKNMVIATTGWYESLSEVEGIVNEAGIGLIYGQNFSIGANLFLQIVANSAKLISRFDYDVYGMEIHHTGKKDSPSGTALKVGQQILDNFPSKKRFQNERVNRQIEKDELHFASIRGGRNPGFHQVVFDSEADSITLSHSAHGRKGFAQGAVLAAEFIQDKKGVHTFDEVFKN